MSTLKSSILEADPLLAESDAGDEHFLASYLARATDTTSSSETTEVVSANVAPTVAINTTIPLGSESRVNEFRSGDQWQPTIVTLAGGGYVVAWQLGAGIIEARIFDSSGVPQTGNIKVSPDIIDGVPRTSPAVAALDGGGFVVTWQKNYDVYARRYDSEGVLQGAEFLVNTYITDAQIGVEAAGLIGGGFVITWESVGQDGSNQGIYAQLYDATGAPQRTEFRVNTVTNGAQVNQSVAALADGGFIIVYESGLHPSGSGFYAQRYDSSGAADGVEIKLVAKTANDRFAKVAALPDGGFLLVWQATVDGNGWGVYARVFGADGAPQGPIIPVNSTTNGDQENPEVMALPDGRFAVVWESLDQDGSGDGIYGQLFSAAGVHDGSEFRVNSFTTDHQARPAIAALDGDTFTVTWQSFFQEGSGYGNEVYTQTFDVSRLASTLEQNAASLKNRIAIDDPDSGSGMLTLAVSAAYGTLTALQGGSGAGVEGSGTGTVTITGTLAQIQAFLGSDASSVFAFTPDTNAPPESTTLTFTLNDNGNSGDGGALTDVETAVIQIISVNDAPAGTNLTIALNEDGATGFDSSSFGFDDSLDGNAMAGVVLTTLPSRGDLYLDGIAITAAGAFVSKTNLDSGLLTYRPDPEGSGISYASFTFQVRDDGGTANGGVDTDQTPNIVTFDVNPINDPPTIQSSVAVLFALEQEALEFGDHLSFTDDDASNGLLTLTLSVDYGHIEVNSVYFAVTGSGTGTVTITGTLENLNASSNLNYYPDTDAPPAQAQLTITIDDNGNSGSGGALSNALTLPIAITSVNDAPSGTDLTIALNEDGATGFHSSSFGFDDSLDGNAMVGVVLTTLPGRGDLYLDGIAITAAGVFVSNADLDSGLLTYRPDPEGNGIGYASFTFQVRDDGGTANGGVDTDQTPNIVTFDVNSINDPPTIFSSIFSIGTFEQQPLSLNGSFEGGATFFSFADPDAGTGEVTVTMSVDHGTITVANPWPMVSGSGTGNVTITGTLESINELFRFNGVGGIVDYHSDSDTPPAEARLMITITDNGHMGAGGALSDSEIIPIAIFPVNDAPFGTDGTIAVDDGQSRVFTGADFGFGDVDGNALLSVRITSLPLEGVLALNGAAVAAGTFVTAADIGAGLLTFTPDAGEGGAAYASFTFQVRDDGGTANGGVDTDTISNRITIDVGLINAAPVLDLNGAAAGSDGAASVTEQAGPVSLAPDLVVSDADDSNIESATVQITAGLQVTDLLSLAGVPSGSLGAISWTYTAATGVLALTGSATVAEYQAVLRQVALATDSDTPGTSRTVTWRVSDGNATSNSPTTAVTVTEINDLPAITLGDSDVLGSEDSDLVFSGPSAITIFDPDFETLTVTLAVPNGTLTLSQTSGLTFSTGDGTGDATMVFFGSAADINAALDGLVYRGSLNFEGGDTLSIIVDDGDATDSDSIAITLADDGIVHGDSGNNVFTGTTQRDVFYLQGGNDTVNGLAGNDTFYFGAAYTTADEVNAGDGNDSIIIQGDYSGGLTVGAITGLESISLAPGNFTSFGDTANNFYDYALTTTDANVAAGSFLKINGFLLRAGEDFTFDGSAETDGTFSLFAGFGTDTLIGGAKNDFFLFGQDGRFAAGDTVVGGAGYDSFYLRGDYTLDFNAPELADSFSEIESVTMASALDTQFFGGGDNEFDYSITWNDAMLASGQTITINGSRLLSNETMTFIGSSELGGHFRIFAGAGDDDLRGGTGNDLILGGRGADNMYGGGGNDIFRFDNAADSLSGSRDTIVDFSLGDRIDLSRIDAKDGTASNEAFAFIGRASFTGAGAASAGEFRVQYFGESGGTDSWFVYGDTDGDGFADMEFQILVIDDHQITATDFIL